MYEKTISNQENEAKRLRQEKIKVKESHGDSVNQRSMYLDLRKIMECKIRMQAQDIKKDEAEQDAMVFGDQYGERLIIADQ